MPSHTQRVVVLGASPKSDRYSNRAVRMLKEYGHEVIPIHPREKEIEGCVVQPSLAAVQGPVDTLTVYVGPARLHPLTQNIIDLAPQRVILNPGTESEAVQQALQDASIPVVTGCTLVMLRSNQFDLDLDPKSLST